MNFELKNIKYLASLSEETSAYTATVYLDGKRFCDVSNHGHGGSDMQHPVAPFTHADILKANEWLAANAEPVDMSAYDMANTPCDLELWCGRELTGHLITSDLRRALKSKVLFTKPGEHAVYQSGLKGKRALSIAEAERIAAQIKAKYAGATILNELSFEDALDIYRKGQA